MPFCFVNVKRKRKETHFGPRTFSLVTLFRSPVAILPGGGKTAKPERQKKKEKEKKTPRACPFHVPVPDLCPICSVAQFPDFL